MVSAIKRVDWLLGATVGLCWAMLVFLGIGLAALVAAIPALLVFQERITGNIFKHYPAASVADVPWLVAILVGAAIIVGLAFLFVRTLLDIVNTVATGDPFSTQNAVRLERMGWVGVAVQVAGLLTGMIAWRFESRVPDLHLDFGVDLSGVILILLLFVLARVFRVGAAMRADLEGTV
jgi:Protein of unknown function (DUF2975)